MSAKESKWLQFVEVCSRAILYLAFLSMVPPHPLDATQSFVDVDEGIELPLCHCAFSGCPSVFDTEEKLKRHLLLQHKDIIRQCCPQCVAADGVTDVTAMMSFYVCAIRLVKVRLPD